MSSSLNEDVDSDEDKQSLGDWLSEDEDPLATDIEAFNAVRLDRHEGLERMEKTTGEMTKPGEMVRSKNTWLTRCPGPNCKAIYSTSDSLDSSSLCRVVCDLCKTRFCFRCGANYHAPTSCKDFSFWLRKCEANLETLVYLRDKTKDCPKCSTVTKRRGGSNFMTCPQCKYEFCRMCLGEWEAHSNLYKRRWHISVNDVNSGEARKELKRYLFYFERWDNLSKLLAKEAETREVVNRRIDEMLSQGDKGTWIDWRPVREAMDSLFKASYTLQHSYPHVYLMSNGAVKEMFECFQAQLELEVQSLSYMFEKLHFSDRAAIVDKAAVAEKFRAALLQEFAVANKIVNAEQQSSDS